MSTHYLQNDMLDEDVTNEYFAQKKQLSTLVFHNCVLLSEPTFQKHLNLMYPCYESQSRPGTQYKSESYHNITTQLTMSRAQLQLFKMPALYHILVRQRYYIKNSRLVGVQQGFVGLIADAVSKIYMLVVQTTQITKKCGCVCHRFKQRQEETDIYRDGSQ